jgi:phosphatidylglycerophosphate synthase
MLAGHFSTALVAHQKFPKGPLLFFLIISQLQDFMWFVFHYLGLEITKPSDAFDATLSNMSVDMLYSHDLIPLLLWLIVVFFLGKILFKSRKIALVGGVLVFLHFILDFFSGHMHHVFGADSMQAGLGLYATWPYIAIGIEAIFSGIVLWYFFKEEAKKGVQRTSKNKAAIIGVFVYGIFFMLIIATNSFREIFSLPGFDLGFNTNMPTLIFTYTAMLYCLHYFVPKYKIEK